MTLIEAGTVCYVCQRNKNPKPCKVSKLTKQPKTQPVENKPANPHQGLCCANLIRLALYLNTE